VPESKAYKNRLRDSEIQEIIGYKKMHAQGKMSDFKPTFDLLGKFGFFRTYPYHIMQKIIERAKLKT